MVTTPGACPDCPDLSSVVVARITIASESTCSTYAGVAGEDGGGVLTPAVSNCPTGSTLQYSVDGGAYTATAPVYNQTVSQSITTRCSCDTDANVNSTESAPIVTTPGACPICPDLSTVVAPDAVIASESACFLFGAGAGSDGGGVLAPPSTPCPAGSQVLYSVDGGAYSSTLPSYIQTSSISVTTICSCIADPAVESIASTGIVTTPGACPAPAAMSCGLTFSSPLCTGDSQGSITVTLAGGAPPYSAELFDASTASLGFAAVATGINIDVFAGLTAGDYEVVVTDNLGSTCINNVTLTDPPMFVSVGGDVNTTEGSVGSILPVYYNSHSFSIGGGTPPYSYDFDRSGYVRYQVGESAIPGYDETINIIYADDAEWSFTITDANGCVVDTPTVFTNDDGNGAGTGSISSEGNILDIDEVVITPESYSSYTAGSQLGDGTITLTMAGCNGGPYTYEWSGPGVAGVDYCVGCQNQTAVESGHYEVVVTCADGQSTQGSYWVPLDRRSGRLKSATGDSQFEVSAFPNPMQASTTIEFIPKTEGDFDVLLFAADGRIVMTEEVKVANKDATYSLDLNRKQLGLPVGIYSLAIRDSNGNQESMQLVIMD